MRDNEKADIQALSARLREGPLTVWATMREDSYETFFGDGYYAYVDQVFPTPTEAARAIETAEDHPMIKWHIRRYDLIASGENIRIRPAATEQEPTTVEVIGEKLGRANKPG